MAEPFADEAYYEENFGSPPTRIADRIDQELARASRYVRRECPDVDLRIAAYDLDPAAQDALDPDLVADIVCEMVTSSASSPGGVGVSSLQQGAGPYQATQTFSNPVGDLYLTKKQKRLLGCGGQIAYTVPMGVTAPKRTWWDVTVP